MTDEKLIALSDLNREDNIKYISSEAQGIAITLDSDRYAPTFCKLERAYICGRRKSEEQIEQLEKENAELSKQLLYVSEQLRLAKEMPYSAVKKFAEEKTQEQLTKAKEIIRDLLSCLYSVEYDCISDLEEAEQFLSEVEK